MKASQKAKWAFIGIGAFLATKAIVKVVATKTTFGQNLVQKFNDAKETAMATFNAAKNAALEEVAAENASE